MQHHRPGAGQECEDNPVNETARSRVSAAEHARDDAEEQARSPQGWSYLVVGVYGSGNFGPAFVIRLTIVIVAIAVVLGIGSLLHYLGPFGDGTKVTRNSGGLTSIQEIHLRGQFGLSVVATIEKTREKTESALRAEPQGEGIENNAEMAAALMCLSTLFGFILVLVVETCWSMDTMDVRSQFLRETAQRQAFQELAILDAESDDSGVMFTDTQFQVVDPVDLFGSCSMEFLYSEEPHNYSRFFSCGSEHSDDTTESSMSTLMFPSTPDQPVPPTPRPQEDPPDPPPPLAGRTRVKLVSGLRMMTPLDWESKTSLVVNYPLATRSYANYGSQHRNEERGVTTDFDALADIRRLYTEKPRPSKWFLAQHRF